MEEVFLTNADFVKSASNISDNINEKSLYAALREAQEIDFQEIVGTSMLNKLKDLISSGDISLPANSYYKGLLDVTQYFLCYQTIVSLIMINAIKIDNAGVNQVTDEHIQNIYMSDIFKIRDYYQNKADYYRKSVMEYCLQYINQLKEITSDNQFKIHSNLYSAANTSIYLGGARGFVIPKRVKDNRKCNKYN